MMNNQEHISTQETKQEESKVLRPPRSRAARLPGAIAASVMVAFGSGVATEASARNDLATLGAVLGGAYLVGKTVEMVQDNNLEEIRDRAGGMEIFIDVEAQKTMRTMGLHYNKARKTVENPSRGETIHFQNQDRNDIAVQVESLDGRRIERTNVCAMTPHQLRYTYIYLDREGKKFGQNVLVCKNSFGNIVASKYKPVRIFDTQ